MGIASYFNKCDDVSHMAHNVDQRQKTHDCYFVDINKLLNYLLLHTVFNAILGLVCLTMSAKSLIPMIVVVTQSCVSAQENPYGISHVREHGNKVQESSLRTNPFWIRLH